MVSVIRSQASDDLEAIKLGVSAVLGSGTVAFLLIPGACAVFAHENLILKRRPVLRDVGAYIISVFLLCVFFRDGIIEVWEAALLVAVYILYLVVTIFSPKIREHYRTRILGKEPRRHISFVHLEKQRRSGKGDQLTDMELADTPDERALLDDNDSNSNDDDGDDDELDDLLHPESAAIRSVHAQEEEGTPATGLRGVLLRIGNVIAWPLRTLFWLTCPNVEEGAKWERLYPLTMLTAFMWVAGFSYLISAIVSRWSSLIGVPTIILGISLVALGGEVPDTVQSVSFARKGYGRLLPTSLLLSFLSFVPVNTWSLC